ncbi:blue copper protein 1b-like isoform X2 [Mercurialis annua]|nr:blue copper protein 1b-like isoform X2 [Mercurialis annua]XP_050213372.1 blue copper protein 1b-like isoform X2 [Mercurialis annua]
MATDYVVGDDAGWKVGVNYTQWAMGKTFHIGDTLMFNYGAPHNVMKVNGAAFKDCNNATGTLLDNPNGMVTLSQAGKKWYICGFGSHCSTGGMKLVINVESDGPAPAPSHSDKILSSWYHILVAVAVVMAMIAM